MNDSAICGLKLGTELFYKLSRRPWVVKALYFCTVYFGEIRDFHLFIFHHRSNILYNTFKSFFLVFGNGYVLKKGFNRWIFNYGIGDRKTVLFLSIGQFIGTTRKS